MPLPPLAACDSVEGGDVYGCLTFSEKGDEWDKSQIEGYDMRMNVDYSSLITNRNIVNWHI